MTKFETALDKVNQGKVSDVVGKHLKVKFKPCPEWFPADYVSNDECIYLEVRCRSNAKGKFPDVIISAKKWVELLSLKFDELSPKVFFVVAWTDCIGIIEIDFGTASLQPFKRTLSASKDRSEYDVVVSIAISEFENIGYGLTLEKSGNWVG